MIPAPRLLSTYRRFHSSAIRNNDEDDNPWGDLDKAFENLSNTSLYQQVYQKSPPSPSVEPGLPPSTDRRNISDMEEMIFAQAGAASVRSSSPSQPALTRGLQFSDQPPNAIGSSTHRWSEYMQGVEATDDSPWASLDAFADNPDSSAQFAVPLRPPQHTLDTQSLTSAAEEAAFSRAGAAAVHNLDAHSDQLTHVDMTTGQAKMVDVGMKPATSRSATAVGRVYMPVNAANLIRQTEASASGVSGKGPVLHTAQLAGIMGAKRTADLIPLCHTLALSNVDVSLTIVDGDATDLDESCVHVSCTAKTVSQTGVEMEALTGCMTACLTIWDMTKAIAGQTMRISDVKVVSKSGGKSGDWVRME